MKAVFTLELHNMTFYILFKYPFLAPETEVWNKHTFRHLVLRTALLPQKRLTQRLKKSQL